MPAIRLKDFKGIAPRLRGAKQHAEVSENTDLYGRTIRPVKENTIIDTTGLSGDEFVKFQDEFVSNIGEKNVIVSDISGYDVRLYKKGNDWRKVIGGRSPESNSVDTPIGLKPPTDAQFGDDNLSIIENSLHNIASILIPTKYSSRESILAEDDYEYFVEAFQVVDEVEQVLARSDTIPLKVEYQRTFPERGYTKGSEAEAEAIGEDGRGDDKNNQRFYLSPGGNKGFLLLEVSEESLRSDERGIPISRPHNVTQTEVIEAKGRVGRTPKGGRPITVTTREVEVSKVARFFPVSNVVEIDHTRLSDRAIESFTGRRGSVTFEGSRFKKSIAPLASPNILKRNQMVIEGTLINEKGDVIKNEFSQVLTDPEIKLDEFDSFSAIISTVPYSGESDTDSPISYRLFRKGTKELAFRVVDENDKLPEFRDVKGPSEELGVEAKRKKTFKYFVTLTRKASDDPEIDPLDEESGPSDNQPKVEWYSVGAKITRPNLSASEIASRNLTLWNVYRLTIAPNGTTNFQLASEVDINTTEFKDFVSDLDLGRVSPSNQTINGIKVTFSDIPENIENMYAFHNRMLFGWRKNQLFWTDINTMHGFSGAFQHDFPYDIVSGVSFGNVFVVVTTHKIFRGLGSDPTLLEFVESPSEDGGVLESPKSVTSSDSGVVFLSDSGLHVFDGVRSESLSDGKIGEEFFRNNINKTGAIIEFNDGTIFLFHDQGILAFDTRSKEIYTMSKIATAVFRDNKAGTLFFKTNIGIEGMFERDDSVQQMRYLMGDIHFGAPGRKQVKYAEFQGTGDINAVPIYDSTRLKAKLIKMDSNENDRRIYMPDVKTFSSFSMDMSGTGEIEEIKLVWNPM